MSARNQRTAAWCPSCGSISEERARPAAAESIAFVPDLRQTADHDRTDAVELRLMSA
jgi:hypothetical protein